MKQPDKAYYLKNLEFALLLSVKGVQRLYGFKMDDISTAEAPEVYEAIFGLGKKKLITIESKKDIKIEPALDEALDSIKNAERLLLYASIGSEHYGQCVYIGRKAVFVSSYGAEGGISHIEAKDIDALPQELCERGFYIEGLIDGMKAQDEPIDDEALEKKADILFAQADCAFDKKEWEGVSDCLRVCSVNDGRCIRQYLLLKGRLDDYFITTDETGSMVFEYSRYKVLDTLSRELLI